MAKKKPPSRGKLFKLKPKPKGKVLPRKSKKKPSPKSAAAAAPSAGRVAPEEHLREAMEELQEARSELSRLGHAMTAAHRALEEQKLSSASSQSNLRAELDAVRTDLKTALAELEIARTDRQRIASTAQRRIHDLEEALARVRAEMAELRSPPLAGPPPTGGSGPQNEPA